MAAPPDNCHIATLPHIRTGDIIQMPGDTQLTLEWQGPIGVGRFPAQTAQTALKAPHVYVTYQKYAGQTVIYVGQSANFLARLWEHYKMFLGLHYLVRDGDGGPFYDPASDNMLETLNRLDESYTTVLADVKRMQVCYAVINQPAVLKPVESMLINAVYDRVPFERNGVTYSCDNTRNEPFGYDGRITIDMNYDAGPVAEEVRAVLTGLFPNQVSSV